MKKKVLSLILALLMTASAASTVLADDTAAIADVEETAAVEEVVAGQYDKAIEFLNNYGIYKGKSADDLAAEDAIERYQMALFVSRISTGWVDDDKWEDGPEDWSEFTDISEGPVANYWGAISYANQKGIVEGYGNGKFGPTDGIKYQDALTMVVRTLGYQGLEWPWGYIQKAVELGLTDGISGVAYSDELNRGEVAQIIYNALFATTKNGSTLALDNFGVEFGWEKIVITASDLNTFVADNEKAEKALKDDKTTVYWKNSNKPEPGFVTFQILNNDGSLADDVYYVQASELGLDGVHDDELAVGESYYVLFEKDEDSNLAKVVAYESLKVDTLVNAGKTDDDGEEQEYPIQEFLADYALVSKYTGNNYVNVTASTKNEIMVFATNGVVTEKVINGNLVAIDWTTGDILVPVDKDEDGEWDVDEETGNIVYEVEWYYNTLLEKYYNYQYDNKYENVIGIDWMSDAEFEDTYEKYFTTETKEYKGFSTAVSKIVKSAYSSLELYDTDLNGVADRGIYESYRLGKFEESTTSDSASYKISKVGTLTKAINAATAKDEDNVDVVDVSFNTIVEGVKDGDKVDRAWFVEGYEPEIEYDEDGEAVGYKTGYVIYNYDAETGAIKVVKNVNDGSDADSYVATGVVRAYNISKGTVTIGEETFHIDQYDELEGSGFKYANYSAATKACYTGLLRDLFNQFVTYVVVDGELVHIEACGQTKSEVIVVDSYAGLSSDGYIVVNGYSTEDLEYDQFRIGSYNGWMKGDYYYYLTEKKAAESFTKGAIYSIASYDAENDVYYVNLAGEFGEDGTYTVENDVNLYNVRIEADGDGYMSYAYTYKKDGKDKTDTNSVKMKDTDKYVIITEITENRPYASVIVYEGKLQDNWYVEGDRINSDDRNNKTYVFVNATTNINDTYKSGLVVLLDDTYWAADYNGTNAEDWYLLGASAFEVSVVDLYTGKLDAVCTGTNIDLKEGHIYYTQGGVLTEDLGMLTADAGAIVREVKNAYGDADTYTAGSIDFVANSDLYVSDKDNAHKIAIEKKCLVGKVADDSYNKFRGDKVDSVSYRVIEFEDGEVADIYAIDRDKIAKYIDKNDITFLPAFYIYDVEGCDIVFYLVESDATVTVVDEELQFTDTVIVANGATEDVQIEASVGYYGKYVNDELVGVTVDGIKLEFVGRDAETATHANVDAQKWFFGLSDACELEDYVSTIIAAYADGADIDKIAPVYESIVVETYGECDKDHDNDECNLVKAVYIPVETIKYDATAEKNVYGDLYIENDDYPVTFTVAIDDTVEAEGDGDGTLDIKVEVTFDVWTDAENTEYDDVYVTCGNVVTLY